MFSSSHKGTSQTYNEEEPWSQLLGVQIHCTQSSVFLWDQRDVDRWVRLMRQNWGEYKIPVGRGSLTTLRKINRFFALDFTFARKKSQQNCSKFSICYHLVRYFGILNPLSWIFCGLQLVNWTGFSILTCENRYDVRTVYTFPPEERWLLDSNFKSAARLQVLRKGSQIQDGGFHDVMWAGRTRERENLLSIARQKLSTDMSYHKEDLWKYFSILHSIYHSESSRECASDQTLYWTETRHFHLHLCVTKEASTAFASF